MILQWYMILQWVWQKIDSMEMFMRKRKMPNHGSMAIFSWRHPKPQKGGKARKGKIGEIGFSPPEQR